MTGNAVAGGQSGYRIVPGIEPSPGRTGFRARDFSNNTAHHVDRGLYCDSACGSPGDPVTGLTVWHAGVAFYFYDRGGFPADGADPHRAMPTLASVAMADCDWFLFAQGVSGNARAHMYKYVGYAVSDSLFLAASNLNPRLKDPKKSKYINSEFAPLHTQEL